MNTTLVYLQYTTPKNKKDKILSLYAESDVLQLMDFRKTVHQSRNVDVDKVLLEWIRQCQFKNFPLNRASMMAQAQKFHAELGTA